MTTDALTHQPALSADTLADLWATLGRAFLPPLEADHWRALHADLPLDLADWTRELGLADVPHADALLEAMQIHPEHENLLVHYSSLFYAPPIRVPINLSLYLDGNPNGPVLDGLARWHGAYGLDRGATFHDQADHLAAVLEFLSLIVRLEENRLAAEFAWTYLLPALPGIMRRMEREGAFASPYMYLLRFIRGALAHIYPLPEASSAQARPRYRERSLSDGWRRCGRCDKPIATERELSVMEKALTQAGLPHDHLKLCSDCRDTAQGWYKRPLPKVR